jgi:hypothetical protein
MNGYGMPLFGTVLRLIDRACHHERVAHVINNRGMMDAGQLRRLQLRQFAAVLHKNLLLQTRARKSILGIGGWGALLLQLLTPVAFFSLMCIPKYYIQPYVHPMYLETQEYQVDTKWWAGASPYEGALGLAHTLHACRLHLPCTHPQAAVVAAG